MPIGDNLGVEAGILPMSEPDSCNNFAFLAVDGKAGGLHSSPSFSRDAKGFTN